MKLKIRSEFISDSKKTAFREIGGFFMGLFHGDSQRFLI